MKPTIEEALDACIEQIRQGRSIDAAVAAYPDFAAELKPLLATASELAALPEPPVALRGLMRELSRAGAEGSPRSEPKRLAQLLPFPSPVWLRVAASVVFLFVVGWGATAISARATPGDWAYPVKRAIERVRLILTVNAADEAELRITFSDRRLAEAVKQVERGQPLNEDLLRAALTETKQALEEVLNASPEERAYLISRAGYLTAHQKNVIDAVAPTARPADRPVASAFSEMCDERMDWMEGMMQDMRMTPAWSGWRQGPRQIPAANTPEETNERKPTNPSREKMRRWMDDCPDWRE